MNLRRTANNALIWVHGNRTHESKQLKFLTKPFSIPLLKVIRDLPNNEQASVKIKVDEPFEQTKFEFLPRVGWNEKSKLMASHKLIIMLLYLQWIFTQHWCEGQILVSNLWSFQLRMKNYYCVTWVWVCCRRWTRLL